MMGIVEEFEKTISQLISEKERESVCNVIARERSVEQKYAMISHSPFLKAANREGADPGGPPSSGASL